MKAIPVYILDSGNLLNREHRPKDANGLDFTNEQLEQFAKECFRFAFSISAKRLTQKALIQNGFDSGYIPSIDEDFSDFWQQKKAELLGKIKAEDVGE